MPTIKFLEQHASYSVGDIVDLDGPLPNDLPSVEYALHLVRLGVAVWSSSMGGGGSGGGGGAVADSTALFALTPEDNDTITTRGYTTEGLGGNTYRYDAASSATIDGGLVMPGEGGSLAWTVSGPDAYGHVTHTFSGTAGTGRWIAVDQSEVTAGQYGLVGDFSDETAAMTSFLDNATTAGAACKLDPGKTYGVSRVRWPVGCRLDGQMSTVKHLASATDSFSRMFEVGAGNRPTALSADAFGGKLENIICDGNKSNRTPYTGYEKEQSALFFAQSDTDTEYRAQYYFENVEWNNSTGDGLHAYIQSDCTVINCRSVGCFRGGITYTGGDVRVFVENFSALANDGDFGIIQAEVDGFGYKASKRISATFINCVTDSWQLENPTGSVVNLINCRGTKRFSFISDQSGWYELDVSGLSAGTYTITFPGATTTGSIAWDADAATVQTAIRAASSAYASATVQESSGLRWIWLSGRGGPATLGLGSATGTATIVELGHPSQLRAQNCRFDTEDDGNFGRLMYSPNGIFTNCAFRLTSITNPTTTNAILAIAQGPSPTADTRFSRGTCEFIGCTFSADAVEPDYGVYIQPTYGNADNHVILDRCVVRGTIEDYPIAIDRGPKTEIKDLITNVTGPTRAVWFSGTTDANYQPHLIFAGEFTHRGTSLNDLVINVVGGIHEHRGYTVDESRSVLDALFTFGPTEIRGGRVIRASGAPTAGDDAFAGDVWVYDDGTNVSEWVAQNSSRTAVTWAMRSTTGGGSSVPTSAYLLTPKVWIPDQNTFTNTAGEETNLGIAPSTTGTLAAWIKTTSTATDDVFGAQEPSQRSRLGISSGKAVGGAAGVIPVTHIVSTTSVNDDAWHHICLTWDSGGTVRLYVNGTEEDSQAYSGTMTTQAYAYGGLNDNGSPSAHFLGDIKAAMILAEELTAAQVAALHELTEP